MSYYISVAVTIVGNIIAVLGLVLLTGFTGMFSMGQAAFMTIGAYSSVLLNRYLGFPYLLAVFSGGVIAMIFGALIGVAPLRNKMRGDTFAICTLGFGTVIRLVISNLNNDVFKGATGISSIPKLTTLTNSLFILVIMVYVMWNFVHSQYGKNCVAVQQQEIAAEMMGVNIFRAKMLSLMISALYCGVAGAQLVFWLQFISPNSFADTRSNNLVSTLVTGGINSVTGPVVAATLFSSLLETLRIFSNWRLVIYGLLLILIMRFRPEGLMGYKEFSIKWFVTTMKSLPENLRSLPGNISKLIKRGGGGQSDAVK
jgi:branched-chain amino acid transport system permease protein